MDPVKRERERRQNNPEYRKHYNQVRAAYARKRRAEDPEYRALLNKRARQYRRKQKLYEQQTKPPHGHQPNTKHRKKIGSRSHHH